MSISGTTVDKYNGPLCPVYQTYTQHPLLPHLVHLSRQIVVHTTKTADPHCSQKITKIWKRQSTKDPLDLPTPEPTSTPSLTAYSRHPYLLSDDDTPTYELSSGLTEEITELQYLSCQIHLSRLSLVSCHHKGQRKMVWVALFRAPLPCEKRKP